MSNYSKTTDFEAKDSLPTGDSGKIIRGAEFETEFDAISTAIATKADTAGPTFTGTLTFETISDGTIGVTAFVDEDNMASNSATLVPTQQSVKAYVDSQVTAQDLDFQADTGGALSIDLDSETMTFTGGTGIDTSGLGNAVTFAIDSTVATLTGTQTLTNKTLTSPDVNTPDIDGGTIDGTVIGGTTPAAVSATTVSATGNITVGGTVDGRDVATDGTKLDGIEAGATADQTAAEIRTLVEAATDSNVFTDADHSKLDGIEAGATGDQTNAEIRAAVEAATDSNVFTDADHSKLDGIEALADVTDTTNVTAAGALMDSELTNITAVKALDQGVATTDTPTFAGLATSANVTFGDNDKAIFGAGSDLQIYHDGTHSRVVDAGTGNLNLQGDNLRLKTADAVGTYLEANNGGAVTITYNSSPKLATTSYGVDITGRLVTTSHIDAPDNAKIRLGDGDDLQIYHSGSHSFISEAGTGDLYIGASSNIALMNAAFSENKLLATTDGALKLYYDGSQKLSTTSTGIDVTGTVTADSAVIDNITIDGTEIDSSSSLSLDIAGNLTIDVDGSTVTLADGGVNFGQFYQNAAGQFNINSPTQDKDIVFLGNDGGSSIEAMRIDMSAGGRVGIGTTSPTAAIHATTATAGYTAKFINTNGASDANGLLIQAGTVGSEYALNVANTAGTTNFMVVKGDGNVGIGTSSPSYALHVATTAGFTAEFQNTAGANHRPVRWTDNSGATVGTLGGDFTNNEFILQGFGTPLVFGAGADGTERMRIDSSGNVGIGTTTAGTLHSSNYGTTKLHIDGGSGRGQVILEGDTNANLVMSDNGATANSRVFITQVNDGLLNFKSVNDNGTSKADIMSLTSAGNVGIGTSSPLDALHIVSAVSSDYRGNLFLDDSTTGFAAGVGGQITFGAEYRSNGDHTEWAAIQGAKANSTDANYAGTLEFKTRAQGGALQTKMVLNDLGNVGIGTTSIGANDRLIIKTAVDNAVDQGLVIQRSANSDEGYINYNGGAFRIVATDGDPIRLGHVSSSDRVSIDASGNLLVGTTNSLPADNSVEGIALSPQYDGGIIQVSRTGQAGLTVNRRTSDGDIQLFKKDGTTVGSIGAKGGTAYLIGSSKGLRVSGSGVIPITTGGTNSDATYDIGDQAVRFKDLYLSGNVTSSGTFRGGAGSASTPTFLTDGSTGMYRASANDIGFSCAGSEVARFDASGNLLVGKTSAAVGTNGAQFLTGGYSGVSATGTTAFFANRNSTDGDVVEIGKNGVKIGSIGVDSSDNLYIGGSAVSHGGLYFGTNTAAPLSAGTLTDDVMDLGTATYRFDDVYATNGTINTSDRNEKQDIEALSDAEQRVAVACKGLLRKFRWKSAVEEKGDEARIHFGIIAQDLQDAFTAEGLDAGRYAMFINSTWTDEETGEERSRMGVRYSELLAFIIAAI